MAPRTFKDRDALARTLGRERAKDTSLDYGAVFAERRGVGGGRGVAPGHSWAIGAGRVASARARPHGLLGSSRENPRRVR